MPKYFYCYYLIKTEKFFRMHLRNLFLQCHKDNQERIETRYNLAPVYDEDGKNISNEEQMKIILEELSNFRKKYNPDFSIGLIIEMFRCWEDNRVIEMINTSKLLKEKYPELICGIDLSGDENNFRTLFDLHKAVLMNNNEILPWIFHCGESLFKNNHNFVDAYLNKVKRIGHGINLIKHLPILEKIKEKNIVFEINPISNQTLRQVRDLRLHPGISYHSYGIKIAISNDDPTLYWTKGVNYDFFVACVTMEFDLIDMKIIVLNSIKGSEAKIEEKEKYLQKFDKNWEIFLNYLIKKYS